MRGSFRVTARPQERLFGRLLSLLVAAGIGALVSIPAHARGVVIDDGWFEIFGDANDGDVMALPFGVNYGAGMQSDVTIQLTDSLAGSPPTSPVGLRFDNGDSLFANVFPDDFTTNVVMLSNDESVSTPLERVDQASIFDFGSMLAPIPPGSDCFGNFLGNTCYVYGPVFDSASFRFIDLSSSGVAGDFELQLLCDANCTDIGFSLGGLNFSSNTFDPDAVPSQLVSYSLPNPSDNIYTSSWDFVFRNPPGVPEPSTWVSMLLGFGFLGVALRRKRNSVLAAS